MEDTRSPEARPEASSKSDSEPSRKRELWVLAAALLFGAALLAVVYAVWRYEGEHPSTDDALVQANFVWISPQVIGQVQSRYVVENQLVKAGAPLFQIDPQPFDERLAQHEADLVLVLHDVDADQSTIQAAQDLVTRNEAALGIARQRNARFQPLVQQGVSSALKGIELSQQQAEAEAGLASARANLDVEMKKLGVTPVQEARLRRARAAVELARLERIWTLVTAPADGYVTRFDLRVGDVVQPGDQLFPFIERDEWWVEANFKETQLAGVEVGMPAVVEIDTYGGHRFRGVVESVSAGSAAAFSLLPPQNTTGNWVKVTQRIPVRVRLLEQDPSRPYRLGQSASVSIDLEAARLPVPPDSHIDRDAPPAPPPSPAP